MIKLNLVDIYEKKYIKNELFIRKNENVFGERMRMSRPNLAKMMSAH